MFHLHTPVLARRDTMREKENFIPVMCSSPGGAVTGPHHKKETNFFTVGKYTPKFRHKPTLKKAVSASSAITPKRTRRKSLVAYIKSKCTPKAESNKLKKRDTNINQSEHIRAAMKKYKSAGVLSQTCATSLTPMDVVEVNCIPSKNMNYPYSDTPVPKNKVRKLDSDSSLRSTDFVIVDSTMASDSSMFNSTSNSSNSSLSSLERTYDLRSLSTNKRSASAMCLKEAKSKTPKIRAGLVTRRSKLSIFEFRDDILEDKENQSEPKKKRRSSLILVSKQE